MASVSGHYIPKDATQQDQFLQKHPTCDGRNVVIAILDTGVDPSCSGLQTTSTGLPKVIECLDLTGAGDVDTSTIKKVDENGILMSLNNRELKIPSSWNNPSGVWHLGTKRVYDLYSADKIKGDTKIKNEENLKKTMVLIADSMKEASKTDLCEKDKRNINAKLEYLEDAKYINSVSPVVDCIVWFDGQKWKGCIDLSFNGDLKNAKVMSNFCENQEYELISDEISYCLNIYDDGNLLEICVPNGSHGTHVAHIAAAHFPNNPEKDGLAPGAQIVSLCVGDFRKGTYLTEQALLRAIERCIQLKVDVINFSYGASPNCVDSGNIAKHITDIVEKHKIIFIAAAGNDGPNLSTMGFANGKLHHSIIYVGAYLTTKMKEQIYGHRQPSNSVVYPFSSRGPCLDGTWGVCISAPGAAITGVPKSEMKNPGLLNGTSMSSPNAAGSIACLLSGMKEKLITISPLRVKLAIKNTAKMPEGESPTCLGAGIIQILSAFKYMEYASPHIPANIIDIRLDINGKHGIYLRDPWEINRTQKMYVEVKAESGNQINDECLIQLTQSKGSKELITYPSQCRLPYSIFQIEIHPTALEPGKAHFAEIVGMSSSNSLLGPLFRIPVTVIVPEKVSKKDNFCCERTLALDPAIPQRVYLKSPVGSKYVAMKITSLEKNKNIECGVHCVYIDFKQVIKQNEHICVAPENTEDLYFPISGNVALEFSFTEEWSNCSSSQILIKMEFYGFSVECGTLSSTNPTNKISFTNNLRNIEINPVIEFTEFCYPLNPCKPVIEPMKERDMIDGNPSFRLLMRYNFYAENSGEYKFEHEGLASYKKYIDCYLLQVFTPTKEYIHTCSWPEYIKLEKGNYVIQVQYRHMNNAAFTFLQQAPLLVTQSIPKIVPSLFKDAGTASRSQGELFQKKVYEQDEKNEFYMEPLRRFPASYPSGSYLKGSIYFQNTLPSKHLSIFNVTYLLSNAFYTDDTNVSYNYTNPENSLSVEFYKQSFHLLTEAADIALYEKNASFLAAFIENFAQCQNFLKDFTMLPHAFYNLANLVLDEYLKTANGIPEIFQNGFIPKTEDVEHIQHSFCPNTSTTNDYPTIENTAKQLLFIMKSSDLLNSKTGSTFVGTSNENEPFDPSLNVDSKNSTSIKEELIEDYEMLPNIMQKDYIITVEKLFEAYMLIADSTSENARIIQTKYAVAHGRFGTALMELKKIMADKTTTSDYLSTEKAIHQILKELGWTHLADEAQKTLLIKHQKNFRLF